MPITDGLLHFWKMDEATGVNRADTVGSITWTQPGNQVTAGAGIINNCAQIISDRFLEAPDHADWTLPDFTIVLWLKADESVILIKSVNEWWLEYFDEANEILRWNVYDSSLGYIQSVDGYLPDDGFWHMVAVHVDSTNDFIGISVDGVGWSRASFGGTVQDSTTVAQFLCDGVGASLHQIDEVGLWNRVLTEDELPYLYNSGNGLPYPFVAGSTLLADVQCVFSASASGSVSFGVSSLTADVQTVFSARASASVRPETPFPPVDDPEAGFFYRGWPIQTARRFNP